MFYCCLFYLDLHSFPTRRSSDLSFLMGVSFTLAFCPTMFMLFLFTLMPVVLATSYGSILPAIFGIGTSLPLLIVIFLIWYFGASGAIRSEEHTSELQSRGHLVCR